MKNDYCIVTTLYDSRNILNQSLFYFYGILDKLLIENRDFDIIIHITEECKEILKKILEQEQISDNDVIYIPLIDDKSSKGMVYRLKSCFDNMSNYKYIATCDSDSDYLTNFHDFNRIEYFSVLAPQSINNGKFNFVWSNSILPGGISIFQYKNFVSNIQRCQNVIDQILSNNQIQIEYGFDEQLLTALCMNEFLHNNIKYYFYDWVQFDEKERYIKESIKLDSKEQKHTYSYIKKFNNSKYYNKEKDIYNLYGKEYFVKKIPDTAKQNVFCNIDISKRKYFFLKVQQYIMGYINDFDVNEIWN